MNAEDLGRLLQGYRFTTSSEALLQQGIERVLREHGIGHEREVRLAARDRIDFLVGDVGVECKVDGSLPSLIRQLERYALHERIGKLLVVSSRLRLGGVPRELHGKRVHFLTILRGIR